MVVEQWAGRIAIFGTRKVPILGHLEFRTDNYVLATVTRHDDGRIALDQRVCKVLFEKAAGAQVSMQQTGPQAMPHAYPVFYPADNGQWLADPWHSGWDASDLDNDGKPGIAIRVKAPFCGGYLHIKTNALSNARMLPMKGALAGSIDIYNEQFVLDASGACLTLMAKDHQQWMYGRLSYIPVPADTDCVNATDDAWPDPMTFAPDLKAPK